MSDIERALKLQERIEEAIAKQKASMIGWPQGSQGHSWREAWALGLEDALLHLHFEFPELDRAPKDHYFICPNCGRRLEWGLKAHAKNHLDEGHEYFQLLLHGPFESGRQYTDHIYVDPHNGNDAHAGRSWKDAVKTFERANEIYFQVRQDPMVVDQC
jgi:hypothetical protein